uniref:Uncharacterized protein n=1 Tax=Anguilla anguilla TaxID=7936 RepID=A0A0E9WH19_ANGAN
MRNPGMSSEQPSGKIATLVAKETGQEQYYFLVFFCVFFLDYIF